MSRSKNQSKTPQQLLQLLQERQDAARGKARTYGMVAGSTLMVMAGIILAAACGYPLGSSLFSTPLGQALCSVLVANIAGIISAVYFWRRLRVNKAIASREQQISRLTP